MLQNWKKRNIVNIPTLIARWIWQNVVSYHRRRHQKYCASIKMCFSLLFIMISLLVLDAVTIDCAKKKKFCTFLCIRDKGFVRDLIVTPKYMLEKKKGDWSKVQSHHKHFKSRARASLRKWYKNISFIIAQVEVYKIGAVCGCADMEVWRFAVI